MHGDEQLHRMRRELDRVAEGKGQRHAGMPVEHEHLISSRHTHLHDRVEEAEAEEELLELGVARAATKEVGVRHLRCGGGAGGESGHTRCPFDELGGSACDRIRYKCS